jgi:riboflavin kinase/FMN adenylyltransferase
MTSRGDGFGRSLGYPTANLMKDDVRAEDGVYFGYATLGEIKHQPAIMFVGTPETTGQVRRRVEAYLLDIPDKDHYGEKLMLTLEEYHRTNQKFATLNDLKHAIRDDELAARSWFKI